MKSASSEDNLASSVPPQICHSYVTMAFKMLLVTVAFLGFEMGFAHPGNTMKIKHSSAHKMSLVEHVSQIISNFASQKLKAMNKGPIMTQQSSMDVRMFLSRMMGLGTKKSERRYKREKSPPGGDWSRLKMMLGQRSRAEPTSTPEDKMEVLPSEPFPHNVLEEPFFPNFYQITNFLPSIEGEYPDLWPGDVVEGNIVD